MQRSAAAFAKSSMRAIGAGWSAAEVRRRASAELLKATPPDRMQWTCADIGSRIGTLETIDELPLSQQLTVRTEDTRGTYMRGFYRFGIKGDRQRGIFSLELYGDLVGSRWQIDAYSVRWDVPETTQNPNSSPVSPQ